VTSGFDYDRFQSRLEALGAAPVANLIVHSNVDSTSSDLRRRLENGAPPGTVVAARCQTAGRGRSGRFWMSDDPGNLYLSTAVALEEIPLERVPFVPLAAGISACDAIRRVCDVPAVLKWPNDVLAAGRKLAGILTELVSPRPPCPVVIIGIGVNTASSAFPPDLRDIAVSIPMLSGAAVSPSDVAAEFIFELGQWTRRIEDGEPGCIVAAWRKRAEPFGRRVRVGEVTGVTCDLTAEGRLQIVRDNGETVEVVGGIVEYAD